MRSYKWWSVFSKGMMPVLTLACALNAAAVVNVDRTRLIFSEGDVAQSLNLSNDGATPMVIQVWMDKGDPGASPDVNLTPVVAIPPVFKMLPGELRSLKLILSSRQGLPNDRESLFWLNIYQIAPDSGENGREDTKVILPLRLRMKMFIRPTGMKPPGEEDERSLRFSSCGERLRIENPSSWYMSLSLHFAGQKKAVSALVEPRGILDIQPPATLTPGERVNYDVITDDGNYRRYQTTIGHNR